MRHTWVGCLTGLAITLGSAAQGQETRTIQGVVRDSASGETLPNATITVRGTSVRSASNRDGFFAVVGAPGSTFTLRVTYIGYVATEITIEAGAVVDRMLMVDMMRMPIELDEISVVADNYKVMRVDEQVSKVTVSPRDLIGLPSVGDVDIFRSLQLLPGISGTNESSSGLYVRGGTPDQNLVLLDGMTVYQVDHFFGFFSAFNADAIKDVQVYKGAFPAQYGGRISSVVDMTGKAGDPNRPHLIASANLLNVGMTGEAPLFGKGSVLFSFRRSYTDVVQTGVYNGIFDMFNGADEAVAAPAGPGGGGPGGGGRGGGGGRFANAETAVSQPTFYFYDLNGKITYRPSTRDVVSVSVYNGQDNLDRSRLTTQAVGGQQNNQLTRGINNDLTDLTSWGNVGASAKWARQWNSRIYSNALFAYSQYFSDYGRNTSIEVRDTDVDTLITTRNFGSVEDNTVRDLTARLDNQWQAFATHRIDFGGWATWMESDYAFIRNDTTTILDRNDRAAQFSGYLQDSWTGIPRLNLTLGGRVSYYEGTGETFLEPRASASYALGRGLTLKGAFGVYHQTVSRVVNENITEGSRDFWLLADGDQVDVTGSTHFVLGAAFETDQFLFDVEVYRKDLTGLSEFSLRFQRQNVDFENLFFDGTGLAKGIEFLAQKKFGKYNGWVSYTLASVEHTFPDLNEGQPFPALHDQRHEFQTINNFVLGRWTLSGTGTFGSGRPYTAPESEYSVTLLDGTEQSYIHVGGKNELRLPAYGRVDVAAHYRFNLGPWTGDIGLSIYNVLDRENVWYREFQLTETPILITDVTYLGITPNLSVRFEI